MKPRLFALRDLSTGRILPDLFFPSKPDAKAKRNELGAEKFCVTYGPDHHAYRG
jgi:hypothetical protein